jgi:hypothetical protein
MAHPYAPTAPPVVAEVESITAHIETLKSVFAAVVAKPDVPALETAACIELPGKPGASSPPLIAVADAVMFNGMDP